MLFVCLFTCCAGWLVNLQRSPGWWQRWSVPAAPPGTETAAPPPVPPPPPGSQSAPSSTSRPRTLLSVAMATVRVLLETGHWFDSRLLQLERDMAGTGRIATALESEVGPRDRRGPEEVGLVGLRKEEEEKEGRRRSWTAMLPSPSRQWTTRSWSAPSAASPSPSPETTWTFSTAASTPPPTWETTEEEVAAAVPGAPPSGHTSLRASQTLTQSSVPHHRTRTGPGLEPSRAEGKTRAEPAEPLNSMKQNVNDTCETVNGVKNFYTSWKVKVKHCGNKGIMVFLFVWMF